MFRDWTKYAVRTAVRIALEPWLPRILLPRGEAAAEVSVHTLISERTYRMGLLALASFEYFSGLRWNVWLHDDGSLSPAAELWIRRSRPWWQIVRRRESDRLAAQMFANHARLLKLRDRHPLAVKMADAWLWAPRMRYIYIDSDCLFFSRPDFILRWARADDGTCWFMREYENVYSYALKPEALNPWAGLAVMPKVNTGIGLLRKDFWDWDCVEALLAKPEVAALDPNDDWYIEQTLSAVLLTRWQKGGLLPSDAYVTGYDVSGFEWNMTRCVACHYVGPTKHDRFFYHGLPAVTRGVIEERFRRKRSAPDKAPAPS